MDRIALTGYLRVAPRTESRTTSTCSPAHFLAFTPSSNRGFSLIEVLVVVALMAFLAVYLGAETAEIAGDRPFYQTSYRMEAIKEAIVGRPGLYCNGIRQFNGYVSDTGNLPDLFYVDDNGESQQVTVSKSGRTKALEGDKSLAAALLGGYRPQPIALWTKVAELPEWRFHKDQQIWAGWRGPYTDPPDDGALRDAWGHRFIFVVGEVIGHAGKTYRCRQTYTATRESQQRPGEAPAYWEVISNAEMNFRTWQDLGTARYPDGKPVENLPEAFKTEQETFYGDSCLTIISLGLDGRPGGEGLDEDLYIAIEPAEFYGEVAGNAGDRGAGNLLARKVCLHVPDYTSQGGQIARLCIPESESELADNSRLYKNQPDSGVDSYTGINFRFGASEAFRRDCRTWECDMADETCSCSRYEQTGCLRAMCNNSYLQSQTPADCACIKCFMDMGTPPNCAIACETAQCNSTPANWDCTCQEYATGDCLEWHCDDPVAGGDCECAILGDPQEDYTNTLRQDIPIGIRTVQADSVVYTIAVHPGGNWIGTVRGD
jgi:prepilin-type N-terminal cleavage/methylation domain-containing protein